jgi:hypothetical protein
VILGTAKTGVEISFKLAVDEVDPAKLVRFVTFQVERSAGSLYFELQTSRTSATLAWDYIESAGVLDGSATRVLVAPLAMGKWISIRIVIDGSAGAANVYVDDVLASQPLPFDPSNLASAATSIYFDILHTDSVGTPSSLDATRFRIDDVAVDLR